ncbi:MAG: YhjD/YihY/BrkB family envelope integrity protein [Candidatus Omnitrophota bacterium]
MKENEIKIMIPKVINFVKRDIWRLSLGKLPRKKYLIVKPLRVILLALRGFDEDKCSLRASALTFYSLLSIVPVFAMAFGIAKGFGFEKILEKQLLERFPVQNEIITNVINFSLSLLENTRGGVVAGIGVILLFWTVIKVLSNIERSFNDIWGIKKMRSLGRRFSDYLSIMLICPVLLILSSGVTVFINTQARAITEEITVLGAISPFIFSVLKLLPYTVIWSVFIFIYIFLPNTKVNFKSASLGGIAAGTAYQILQWLYVDFQVGVAKYNAIYGSFAALPLFLVWLQISWLIVLFGAEISFAHQNVDTYEFEADCLSVSHSFKRLLSLRVTNLLVKSFSNDGMALTANQISHELEIPIRLVRDILYELSEAGLISGIQGEKEKAIAYQPAIDINKMKIKYVVDKLELRGSDNIPVTKTPELEKLRESLRALDQAIEKSSGNLNLKDI